MRPGARFGPAGIRDASLLLRPFNPAQEVDVFAALSIADLGDLHTTPGNAERTAEQIADAAVHGPLGVVLLDAHADTWEQYYGERYFHGTPFKRALRPQGR